MEGALEGALAVPRRVLSGQAATALELCDALCCSVEPRGCGPLLSDLAGCVVPQHLRRVWKREGGLQVLLCVAGDEAGAAAARKHGLQALPVRVPRHPPSNAQQADSWSALHWPVLFNKVLAARADEPLSEAEVGAMRAGMRLAHAAAHAAALQGQRRNGCVIVDPASGAVVARGEQATEVGGEPCFSGWRGDAPCGPHPLRHAVKAALDAAARREAAMHPKRKRQEPGEPDQRPYLCTGWDCYTVHEPCIMCAMALVHSRVRRVIYAQTGAQGWGVGRLMGVRTLNHHYEVFQLTADAQCE